MTRSPLPMLIRRARMAVDEQRAELAELVEQESRAQAAVQAHEARMAAEQMQLAESGLDAKMGFTAWLHHHRRLQTGLEDRLAKLNRSRESAQEALLRSCADLKALELADEARLQAEAQAAARREEAKSEEIAMIMRDHAKRATGSRAA